MHLKTGRAVEGWAGRLSWYGLLAVAAAAVAAGSVGWSADGAYRVAAGRVCRSALPPGLELSCGADGFGDLRRVCSGGGACTRTTAVTVRNDGTSAVYVSVVSGPRQGVREQGADHLVRSGDTVVLRPGRAEYLFDITLRAARSGPAVLAVVRVR
ncbi:hypothetical protein [Streptomyces sp. NPDC006997]|uniref:hypothetical protein n=1 Tax=Streptomyces sp. NPDC006997 TaxID=3155356 RepID=UPI0033CCEACA